MNSIPGRLTGSGIRPLPAERIPPILARLKLRHRKGFRVESARYRITGFRDPGSGAWISRDPKNGQYYRVAGRARAGTERREKGQAARRRTQVRPTVELLAKSSMLALEVEIDRGRGPRIYYVSLPGVR